MNLDISLISIPVGGAVIGYITNWLAIKMLFRPYVEKRIMGIKVPFTPGLIPKERQRIAKAIGEVVGNHLLTRDVIVDELTNSNMEQGIIDFIDKRIFVDKGQLDINKLIKEYFEVDINKSSITDIISHKILKIVREEATINQISLAVTNQVMKLLGDMPVKDQEASIDALIANILNANETKSFLVTELVKFIDSREKISELLGERICNEFEGAISFQEPKIKMAISNLLEKEEVAVTTKKMISDVVMEKVGALGAMFISPDGIYESMVSIIGEKLEEIEVSKYINDYLRNVFEEQLCELVPENTRTSIIEELVNRMLGEKIIADLKAYILNSDKSILDVVNEVTAFRAREHLEIFLNQQLKKIVINEDKALAFINAGILRFTKNIIEKPIVLSDEQRSQLDSKVIRVYNNIVKGNVPEFIGSSKITNLVEKQINSFEIKMLEEIILGIAKKELSAITWLGAGLGFVMSLIILILR